MKESIDILKKELAQIEARRELLKKTIRQAETISTGMIRIERNKQRIGEPYCVKFLKQEVPETIFYEPKWFTILTADTMDRALDGLKQLRYDIDIILREQEGHEQQE